MSEVASPHRTDAGIGVDLQRVDLQRVERQLERMDL
jgi:hypothetical protein